MMNSILTNFMEKLMHYLSIDSANASNFMLRTEIVKSEYILRYIIKVYVSVIPIRILKVYCFNSILFPLRFLLLPQRFPWIYRGCNIIWLIKLYEVSKFIKFKDGIDRRIYKPSQFNCIQFTLMYVYIYMSLPLFNWIRVLNGYLVHWNNDCLTVIVTALCSIRNIRSCCLMKFFNLREGLSFNMGAWNLFINYCWSFSINLK